MNYKPKIIQVNNVKNEKQNETYIKIQIKKYKPDTQI